MHSFPLPAHRALALTQSVMTGLYIGYKAVRRVAFQAEVLPDGKDVVTTPVSGQMFQLSALLQWALTVPLLYVSVVQIFSLFINRLSDDKSDDDANGRTSGGGRVRSAFTVNWWWGGFLAAVAVLWLSLVAGLINIHLGITLALAVVAGEAGPRSLQSRYLKYLGVSNGFLLIFSIAAVYHMYYYVAFNEMAGGSLKSSGDYTWLPNTRNRDDTERGNFPGRGRSN